jgi:CRP-like cAMP-binding protein
MGQETEALSPFGVATLGPTIDDLPPEARQFLEQRGALRHYREGEAVQRHLVLPDHASWLKAGRIKSVVWRADGSEQHGGWIMPSELFGVDNMLLQCPSRSTLLVVTESATLMHFSRALLLDMLAVVPDATVGIATGLSRRIQQFHDIIDVSGPRTLAEQLRVVLVWWAKNHGIPALDGSVELWVSQNDLATGVGGSRQRVHLELQNLRDLGEVDLAYRKIIIRPSFFKGLDFQAICKRAP